MIPKTLERLARQFEIAAGFIQIHVLTSGTGLSYKLCADLLSGMAERGDLIPGEAYYHENCPDLSWEAALMTVRRAGEDYPHWPFTCPACEEEVDYEDVYQEIVYFLPQEEKKRKRSLPPLDIRGGEMTVGGAVRLLRHLRGMTQVVLAEQAGCTNRFISYLENGERGVTVRQLRDIARGLNVPAALLVQIAELKDLDAQSLTLEEQSDDGN